ncbi:hypothetical protein JHK86_039441 [Glycine max]|nr:hypothetical protein JHK86_039441 [Glycine max]
MASNIVLEVYDLCADKAMLEYALQEEQEKARLYNTELDNLGAEYEVMVQNYAEELAASRANQETLMMLSLECDELKAKNVSYNRRISTTEKVTSELEDCKCSKIELEEKNLRLQWNLTIKEASCHNNAQLKYEVAQIKDWHLRILEGNNLMVENNEENVKKDLELPLVDLATIVKATDGFSINNKLGEGGFGVVYMGTLDDGHEIAVKRLSQSSGQGYNEFKNEVILIAKIQNQNLVKYEQSERSYKNFMELKPGDSAAKKELSQLLQAQSALETTHSLYDLGNFSKSLEYIDKVVLVFSSACNKAKLLIVKVLIVDKEYESAIVESGFLLKEDENNLEAFIRVKSNFNYGPTSFIFKILEQIKIEPTTNQTYGELLKNLTQIKTFASGILVPKGYIWPVDSDLYLQPHTPLVSNAHREGLQVFVSDVVNDVPFSYDSSYDPLDERLSFIDGGDFSVDGVLFDFPTTASTVISKFVSFV